jgi:hypothetical protein
MEAWKLPKLIKSGKGNSQLRNRFKASTKMSTIKRQVTPSAKNIIF